MMDFLDLRNIIFSSFITNLVSTVVLILLWRQNRHRFDGTGYWMVGFAMQTIGQAMIFMRGSIPEWLSIVIANVFFIGGVQMGLIGLERFLHRRSTQTFNILLLTVFAIVHIWFTYADPNLSVRSLNVAVAGFIVFSISSVVVLRKIDPGMRRAAGILGFTFIGFTLISLVRIIDFFVGDHSTQNFLQSGTINGLAMIGYQILFMLLTYGLALMFNRRLLEELEGQEEKFSKAFHSAPYAIVLSDTQDRKVVEVNKSFTGITGWTPAEVIGKSNQELQIWHLDEERKSSLDLLGREGRIEAQEYHFRKKSGEIMTGLMNADIITIQGDSYILTSIVDISDRKLAEQKLRESEQRFREMSEMMPQIIFETDAKGNFVYVNKQAYKIFGYPEDYPIIGSSSLRFHHPDEIPRAIESINRRSTGQSVDNHEYKMVRRDGTTFQTLIYSEPIIRDGQSCGLRGIIVDITDRKHAEELLIENEKNLRELNATKDKFFSIIAHDLMSPFNTILGFSNILEEEVENNNPEQIARYARMIHLSALRTQHLLVNLLEWSRSQTGRIVFNPEPFNLVLLTGEIVELLAPNARQKSITFSLSMPESIDIMADKDMISAVLRNLISNALKFSHPGGTITLSAGTDQDQVMFSVQDEGIGIDPAIREKIFRLDENYSTRGTENEKGTGLGLILCKEFITLHHGRIWAESEPGHGSIFRFTIPRVSTN